MFYVTVLFQSTRLSRASTDSNRRRDSQIKISIHRALASLDLVTLYQLSLRNYFDPQGSREPRRCSGALPEDFRYFDPQGSREPRRFCLAFGVNGKSISIHRALASLDILLGWKIRQRRFRSTGLSRASTAKMHNYSCIYATFTCFILYIFYKSFFKLKFPRVI